MIEMMEKTPDTVLTLSNGNKIVVQEQIKDIIDLVVEFKSRCLFRQDEERVEY